MPVPHALNESFTWRSRAGPFRRVTAEQARAYDEQGFFVLEGALSAQTCAEVIAAIDPLEAIGEELLRQHGGKLFIARAGEITFTPHLVTRSSALRDFCAGPVFCDLVHDLIGPDVRLYWDQSVYKKPGTELPFPWHQDNGYTFVEPQQYLTCWVALTETDERNGCPWVVPGLHRGGTLHHETSELGFVCLSDPPEGAVPVPAKAGDIVVFSSLTPHATGANTSSSVRKTYIVQFAPDGAQIVSKQGVRAPANAPDRQFTVLVNGERPA